MSFINNALKRAADERPADKSPAAGPQLLPVDCPPSRAHSNLPLLALIAVVLLLSGFMMWAWFRAGKDDDLKARARASDAAVKAASEPAKMPIAPVIAPIAEKKPEVNSSSNAVAAEKTAPEPVTKAAPAVEAPKPAPVTYKLQGILYQPGRSSAVINGKTVYAGERVADARVVSISVDTVVLVNAQGQTNLLELP